MSRLFVDDLNRKDPRALITTEKMARLSDIVAPTPQYITATSDKEISVSKGCAIAIESGALFFTEQNTTLDEAKLDSGSAFSIGKDYYVYICDTGNPGDNERFIISLNSTYPTGWNALNSRKIGGFHYGVMRATDNRLQPVNSAGVAFGTGWESNVRNAILPRSVWTLAHRPKCSTEGMVYLTNNFWSDIYLSSDDGAGGLKSEYNTLPMGGSEGMNWYTMNERALKSGKRMLDYSEFCMAAFGSPQGLANANTNAWSATTNTARQKTGFVTGAVSSVGVRDAVGNMWKWLNELVHDPTATTIAYYDPMAGKGFGQFYMYSNTGLHAFLAGGQWNSGAQAGSRMVACANPPWDSHAPFAVLLGCDGL